MEKEPLTISVDECAKLLGISRNNAYILIRRGEIPAVKLGERRTVVPYQAIKEMLGQKVPTYSGEEEPILSDKQIEDVATVLAKIIVRLSKEGKLLQLINEVR